MSVGTLWEPLERAATTIRELRRRNGILFAVAVTNVGLAVVFTALMALDGRTLLGRNVWTKPWKFATSIAIYTATMGWLLPSLSLAERVERLATYTIGAAMTIEIALISTQAARGVASHFNTSTALNTSIFAVMGVTITISSVVTAYALYRFVRSPPDLSPAYLWGLGLGMLLFVLASFEGWLMVAREGHAVGAPADGAGLPLLNWSLTGGDLRIAHFIGLHALQVLPLTGYVATKWAGGSQHRALGIVAIVGTLYTALVGGTFVLALLGTPLVSAVTFPTASPGVLAAVLLAGSLCAAAGLAAAWGHHRGPTAHSDGAT